MSNKGYFGIGVFNPKTSENIGTLWRHAMLYNASFIFTIGARYKSQPTDTSKADRHIPLFNYKDMADFIEHKPIDCPITCIELTPASMPLGKYKHPLRAIYLLGAEDSGLPSELILEHADSAVQIEAPNVQSMNVATAGTIVMYDRYIKRTGVKL